MNRWRVVIGGISMNLALGSLYAWSVFVLPLEKEFGWTRAQTSWVFTIAIVTFALTFILAGRIQDKLGPRPCALLGALLVSAGFFLASTTTSLLFLYVVFGLIVGAGNGFGYATPIPVASKWFPDKRGLVVGLMVGGYGASSAIIGPLATRWIGSMGWRPTFQLLGAAFFVLGMIGTWLMVNPPQGYRPAGWSPKAAATGTAHDYTPLQMLRTPRFYEMWVAYCLGTTAGLMTISQLVPFARSAGLTAAAATFAITVGALGNAGGRILSGWLSDTLGRLTTLRIMILGSAIAMPALFLFREQTLLLYVLVIAVYWCYGTQLSVFASTTADMYGTRNLGMNYGLLFTAWGAAGIIGPMIGAWAYDAFGGYRYAFYAASVLAVVAFGSLTLASSSRSYKSVAASAVVLLSVVSLWPITAGSQAPPAFHLEEATIDSVHSAYRAGRLTSHQLVQFYLNRIEAYDKKGPAINAVITINPKALEEADRLDAAFKASGFVGPLHGIPVILKDQFDAKGLPTTLGSILFKDYYPDRDSFVAEKLRKAGAIILAKTTLGELGGGDTHGSLFGSTRNPYGLERTVGGSSGGSGAGLAANFATIAVGEEGFASIRRPSTWNSVVGMRPTAGLVSRSGMYDGWPEVNGSLGPMARTVTDLAKLLEVMVGYDSEDPLTARGVGHVPETYTKFLDRNGLRGARIGILREPMGQGSEPQSEDFAKITAVFNKAVAELKTAGATLIDPITIPKLNELLAKRATSPTEVSEAFKVFVGRSAKPPFKTFQEMLAAPGFAKLVPYAQNRLRGTSDESRHYQFLRAQDELMTNVMKVMADNKLDAIAFKSVEHQPTLIKDGVNPPFVNTKGVPHLNTFLVFVPAIAVPAGFTTDNLPAGITFMGRPYDEGTLLKLAYGYEQATHHRRSPKTAPPLAGEP